MRKTISGILIFLATGTVTYHSVIFLTPYVVLLKVKLNSRSKFNQPVYADVLTDRDRHVVLPNPDFIYVVSGYDIRKSPVRITGRMPDSTYSSIAFYSNNTLNFYIKNDKQTPSKELNIVLVNEGDSAEYFGEGEEIVESPSSFGTVMVRMLINDTSRISYLKEIQRTFKIETL